MPSTCRAARVQRHAAVVQGTQRVRDLGVVRLAQQVARGARAERGDHQRVVVHVRHRHHLRARLRGAYALDQRGAVAGRAQLHVDQHQVEQEGGQQAFGFRARERLQHLLPRRQRAEDVPQAQRDRGVGLHQQGTEKRNGPQHVHGGAQGAGFGCATRLALRGCRQPAPCGWAAASARESVMSASVERL
jgi:hypothetical protein